MIKSYKGRTLNIEKIVEIYRNLHQNNLFSIRDSKTKLVLAHGDRFAIKLIKPIVSETGRQRVIQEQRKNVHAVLQGNYIGEINEIKLGSEVKYNPYITEEFQGIESEVIYFIDGKCFNVRSD